MGKRQIAIIGGGLAGLAAGIYAQQNGYDTCIFEHHALPGGVCTAWKRKGYTIDGCIHWLMGAKPGSDMYRIYQEAGVLEGDPLIPLTHYARYLEEATGNAVYFTKEVERAKAEMLALSASDRGLIEWFFKGIQTLRGFPMPVLKPMELMGPLEKAGFMLRLAKYWPVMSKAMVPMEDFGAKFKNWTLAQFFPNLFAPQIPLIFGMTVLSSLVEGELAGYRGGSLEFALKMARRYEALGGRIRYNSRVTRILVKGGNATGVELADGSKEGADLVVSAADGHSTIFELLGGSFVDDRIRQIYSSWPRFQPICLVSFGVSHDLGGGDPGTVLFTRKPLAQAGRVGSMVHYRTFHHDPSLAPEGHSIVQAMVGTEWEYWRKLAEDRPAYEAAKQALAEEVLERLTPHLPGLSGQVEMTDVATPYTTWRYTLNENGYYEGFMSTPVSFRNPPPKTLPGLNNFHMVGQWVEPGGGIPPALFGSRHLVMKLCRAEGREFRADLV